MDDVERARIAVMLSPGEMELWRELAKQVVRARRWQDLANAMANAVARFPDDVWVWEHLALAALELGDANDAIRVAVSGLRRTQSAATRAAPSTFEVGGLWAVLARAFRMCGELDAADDASLKALALSAEVAHEIALKVARDHSHEPVAWHLLAAVAAARGESERARCYAQAVADPELRALLLSD